MEELPSLLLDSSSMLTLILSTFGSCRVRSICFCIRQVSATFAASLVTSPAIGAYLSVQYSDSLVVLIATVIAVVDIAFVFFAVPESLPDKMRLTSWGFPISWEQADPFAVSTVTSRRRRSTPTSSYSRNMMMID